MASCADIPEIPDTSDADDRDIRNVHQAVLTDGQTVCKHNGWTCHDTRTSVCNLCDGQAWTCHQRFHDCCDHALRSVHGLPRALGGLYPGLCLYNAVGCVYWYVTLN